jgi:hypothetical protein
METLTSSPISVKNGPFSEKNSPLEFLFSPLSPMEGNLHDFRWRWWSPLQLHFIIGRRDVHVCRKEMVLGFFSSMPHYCGFQSLVSEDFCELILLFFGTQEAANTHDKSTL